MDDGGREGGIEMVKVCDFDAAISVRGTAVGRCAEGSTLEGPCDKLVSPRRVAYVPHQLQHIPQPVPGIRAERTAAGNSAAQESDSPRRAPRERPAAIMSCIDVMFQPYQHHFFSHPAPTQQFELYRKMQESTLGLSSTASASADFAAHSVGHTSTAAPSTSTGASGGAATGSRNHTNKDSEATNSATTGGNNGGEKPPEAEYINSKCVLFTYFSGDCNSVVDEHFSRALSQPSSFGTDTTASATTSKAETSAWKSVGDTTSPMAQRNFPPSFWNSAYQPPTSSLTSPHPDPLHPYTDPYHPHTSALHSHHYNPDPWHPYALGASSQSSYHQPIHHDMYSMASSSHFNPRYSSLLIQPTVRPGRLPAVPGQCDLGKPDSAWTRPYGADQMGTDFPGLATDRSLEHHGQESAVSKDLYWF
ncbi:transcription cofactor vestigial-like protein 2 [Branchiostoma floridae x Branchiostoma belcheri]